MGKEKRRRERKKMMEQKEGEEGEKTEKQRCSRLVPTSHLECTFVHCFQYKYNTQKS